MCNYASNVLREIIEKKKGKYHPCFASIGHKLVIPKLIPKTMFHLKLNLELVLQKIFSVSINFREDTQAGFNFCFGSAGEAWLS